MTSIYQRALGPEFEKLHPMIQKRFGFATDDGVACVSRGLMTRVWIGSNNLVPLSWLGSWRNVLSPETGQDVPFQLENHAYRDSFGRETVAWVHTLEFSGRRRRVDATMIFSEERRKIVDYLGTHQDIAMDLDAAVTPNGGLELRGREQRFHPRELGVSLSAALAANVVVREWYEGATGRFHVEAVVSNEKLGRLFGYEGTFEAEFRAIRPGDVPASVKPLREERRE